MNKSDTLTEQQIADRRHGIGGSDVAAILEMSPFKSPLDVYLEKIGEADSTQENERMYWGSRLESLVADEYSLRHDRKVRRRHQAVVHKKYTWMRANVDRIVINLDRLLECKTTSERNAELWGEPGTDEIPELYMAQAQHYLIVTGRPVIDVAVLIGGQEYRDYTVEADREIHDMLIEEEHRFWDEHVLRGVPPAPRSVEEAQRLWPKHTDRSVLADDPVVEVVNRLREVKDEQKRLEADEKDLKLHIQQYMGDAAVLFDPDGQKPLVTWKSNDVTRLDGKRLQAEQPHLAKQYMATTTQRRLLVK